MARKTTSDLRGDAQTCPVCGQTLTTAETGELVRAWPGKLAHADCATYAPRTRRRWRLRHPHGARTHG